MYSRTKLIIYILLAIACLALGAIESARPLPELLHCSSTLWLRKPKSINVFNIDEYLDIKGRRSSLLIEDGIHNEVSIYYNQLSPNRTGPRQFIQYDPSRWACKSQAIGFWQFNELRKLAIYMSELEDLREEFVDVPIGPSVLLFAINNNIDKFGFVGQTYSKTRLSMMNVYSHGMVFSNAMGPRMWVQVMVHVPRRVNWQAEPKKGDSLGGLLSDTALGVSNIALVGGCIMNSEMEDYIPEAELKKEGELDPDHLNEDNFCPRNMQLFMVRFNLVGEHQPGTLLGKTLVQLGRGHLFYNEPFMRPVGIGCWGSGNEVNEDNNDGGTLVGQKLRQLARGQAQFSAVYTKKRGLGGLAFVAYDSQNGLLRIDRDGQKSIFDLVSRKSYHAGEYNPSSSSWGAGVDPAMERCVVLQMDEPKRDSGMVLEQWWPRANDPLSVSSEYGSIMERLIGLSYDEAKEHHIGMRVIDHVHYEVFERDIKRQPESDLFDVPIILLPDRQVSFDESVKLYITFYARLDSDSTTAQLKFVELWAFDVIKKRKTFVNRVQFIEFSWSLDVVPANDIESQSNNMNLFSMGPCFQNRASQAELVVEYTRSSFDQAESFKELSQQQQVALLKANEETIYNMQTKLLCDTMQISRLNLIDLKLSITPQATLITSNRVADLRQGLTEMKRLGLIDMRHLTRWRQYLKQVLPNSHWFRDCQLASIGWHEVNYFAHCSGAALCMIFAQDERLKDSFLTQASVQKANEPSICIMFSLKYATTDKLENSMSAAARADLNAWRMTRTTFSLMLDYQDNERNQRQFAYKASAVIRKFDHLSALGPKLLNELSLLDGLRHTVAQDELAGGINTNQRIALTSDKLNPFQQCQLACQMDNQCASFSICSKQPDCIISSLRLTSERVSSMLESTNENKDRYQLRVTNDCSSQEFVMKRDDSCSLHPRDFLADYQVDATPVVLVRSDDDGDETKQSRDKSRREEEFGERVRPVSLEDCASENFERCADDEPHVNNFTYCPIESLCLPKGVPINKRNHLAKSNRLTCFVYARRLSGIYLKKRTTEMRIAYRHGETIEPPNKTAAAIMNGMDGLDINGKRVAVERGNYAKYLWGLDEEGCARECNLHKSNCLAFDSCRYERHTLCSLFLIRSPISEVGAYSPLTKLEQQAQEVALVRLGGSNLCTHHPLKPAYFQVRLRQILEKEKRPSSTSSQQDSSAAAASNEKRLNELEDLITSSDSARDKLERSEIDKELRLALERRKRELLLASQMQSIRVNFVLLMIGMLIGSVCVVFKAELTQVASMAHQQLGARPFEFVRYQNEDEQEQQQQQQNTSRGFIREDNLPSSRGF